MVSSFANLREALDSSERAALVEFDGHVYHAVKMLQAQVDAMQVWKRQAVASVTAGAQFNFTLDVSLEQVNVPIFNDVGMSALRNEFQAGKCWSVDLVSDDVANDRKRCELIEGLQLFVTEAKEDVSHNVFGKHCGALTQWSCQGVPLFTMAIPGDFSVAGFAVSPDGTMTALTDFFSNSIILIQNPCGKIIRTFNIVLWQNTGSVFGVCFGHTGQSLLVTISNFACIQEITLNGEFVRFIGAGYHGGIRLLDANSRVVVATASSISNSIYLWDYNSGEFLKDIGSKFTKGQSLFEWISIKLSPDGECVCVVAKNPRSVFMVNLEGESILQISHPGNFYPSSVTFLPFGEIVVAGKMEGVCTVNILSKDATDVKAHIVVGDDTLFMELWPTVISVSNFVCVVVANKFHVFW